MFKDNDTILQQTVAANWETLQFREVVFFWRAKMYLLAI